MLRMETGTGWWLVTHTDHARLAGAFAAAWGNDSFRRPEPRDRVLYGIASHDDGWAVRDAHPTITKAGKPSAFSSELVGKYSAFEEIDLAEYLRVRERAVRMIAEKDAYAAMLIAKHTYNLLTVHADRSTIATEQLPLLDEFLIGQAAYQARLMESIGNDAELGPEQKNVAAIDEHFKLLQACDNLSLLTCVAYDQPAHLLHALPLVDGGAAEVKVVPVGVREFKLEPWPFAEDRLTVSYPARHVEGHVFGSSEELEEAFMVAPVEMLVVQLIR